MESMTLRALKYRFQVCEVLTWFEAQNQTHHIVSDFGNFPTQFSPCLGISSTNILYKLDNLRGVMMLPLHLKQSLKFFNSITPDNIFQFVLLQFKSVHLSLEKKKKIKLESSWLTMLC